MAARTSVWSLRHGAQHRQGCPNGGRYGPIVHKLGTLRQKARAPTRRALNPALVGDAESKSLRSGRAVRIGNVRLARMRPAAQGPTPALRAILMMCRCRVAKCCKRTDAQDSERRSLDRWPRPCTTAALRGGLRFERCMSQTKQKLTPAKCLCNTCPLGCSGACSPSP
jgi:hypothetical protein